MEQLLYVAYRIHRGQKSPWTPDSPPISQPAPLDTLKKHLLVSPWEQLYELGVDALPGDVPDIQEVMPATGALIVVRVRDPGPNLVRSMDTHYQYFQVQLDRLPANPVRDTERPASPKASARNIGGRPKLHPSIIVDFQQEIRAIVLDHYQKNQRQNPEEARIREDRVIEQMDISVQKWRTRLKRTKEDWQVNSWEEILDYIILSKTYS